MMTVRDPFELNRFVDAQDGVFAQALREVRRGRKQTHWRFVFPQLVGLGRSEMARRYGIASLDEARAFLDHPVLGPNYREIVTALQDLQTADAERVFGAVDAQKLRHSLTLFSMVAEHPLIQAVLQRWFGSPDRATLERAK